jgi:long-chain acyl-CoA synthetase
LKIIDRKKNIFKLSQGEYIAPEKLEQAYIKSSYIGQVFIYGDSLHDILVAIIIPDRVMVEKWDKIETEIKTDEDYEKLIKS